MNNYKYQQNELSEFLSGKHGYFETSAEFNSHIEKLGEEELTTQIEWIENGSYGCGACVALQNAERWGSASKRRNLKAAVGKVVILAIAGQPVRGQSIGMRAQNIIVAAVEKWLSRPEKNYSIKSIIAQL